MKKKVKSKTVIYELKTGQPLTARQKRELQKLAALPDERIDTSDIPEIPPGTWKNAMRGSFEGKTVDQFRDLERELAKKFPTALKEAEELADQITDPQTAVADEIWPRAWNKPLYANTRVSIGTRWVQQLKPYMNSAWHHWGTNDGTVLIEKVGKGIAPSSFTATKAATDIRQKTRIPVHRLYAIQGAARALRARAAKNEAPYADLVQADLGEAVQALRSEMGPGWGPITVLHFLTDLGLACKPDLHLVQTAHYLWPSLNLKARQVPNLQEAIRINHSVRRLVEKLDGSFSPARLRYIDKILMELSLQGLIPNP